MVTDIATFLRLDIRVGTIRTAAPLVGARRPAYRLEIDFGAPLGIRQSSAQITGLYQPEALIGRQVLAVVNFPPRQIGKFRSEVLTLGVPDDAGRVVLIQPDRSVPDGGRLY
ncbi:MAG: tRNA-binding protein [Azospirillaceae bacterium]|nr:tRNA-binding protein [Azospirillaceae bacterium]